MDDELRKPLIEKMSPQLQDMIMEKAATMTRPISEGMDEIIEDPAKPTVDILKTGNFVGL